MKIVNRDQFMKRSMETIKEMLDMLEGLQGIKLTDLQGDRTALVIVDMINGFAREGALKSDRVEELIPEIVRLSKNVMSWEFKKFPSPIVTLKHRLNLVHILNTAWQEQAKPMWWMKSKRLEAIN